MIRSNIQMVDRKTDLIKAACEIIAEKGFEGLRIRDVASHVGINPASMYYYFPTKEALIEDVVEFVFSILGITSEEAPGTPKEQLHTHLTRLYRQMRDDPGVFTVFAEIQLRAGRSTSSQKFQEFENKWRNKLVTLLQTGIKQGYWPNYLDPEQVATTIILMMQGAGLQATTNPRRIESSIAQLERWITGR
jgi:AcrR family transcriptional regulator